MRRPLCERRRVGKRRITLQSACARPAAGFRTNAGRVLEVAQAGPEGSVGRICVGPGQAHVWFGVSASGMLPVISAVVIFPFARLVVAAIPKLFHALATRRSMLLTAPSRTSVHRRVLPS